MRQTKVRSTWKSKMCLCSLPFFGRCEECPGILAQHYVCLRYPSWFQNYICFIILCMFIRGKKTSGFCMTTLKKWITKDFHIGMHASVYPHLVFTCSHVPEKVMMPQSGCGGLNVTATVICNNDPFIRITFENPTSRLILSRCPFFFQANCISKMITS